MYEEIHKLSLLIWNKEELSQEWKEPIIIPVYKKDDEMDCNNYRRISLLSTSFKFFSYIFLSRMTPYLNEILGEYQCGFRRNRSKEVGIQ